MTPAPSPGLFIAGTDTGVGKTVVACALLRAAHNRGLRLIPFKPAETGATPDPRDAYALHHAAGASVPRDQVCLYALPLPAAPQAAASQAGVTIGLDPILQRALALASAGDGLLIEAAGGLLVPYAPGLTGADLAGHLRRPVLLVARAALGTINHTALSVAELRRRYLELAGIILVRTRPEAEPHEATNALLIEQLTGITPLGILPHLRDSPSNPSGLPDPDQLAQALEQALGSSALARLLARATGTALPS